MGVIERAGLELQYRKALRHKDENEAAGSDCCVIHDKLDTLRTPELASVLATAKGGPEPHEWVEARDAGVGARVPHGGKVIADIKGMGKVYDWTSSPWTPVSGGKIKPILYVDHIPVIHNAPGIQDFITLRNVLVAQGLMVQQATDASGNVALYTPLNFLCFQARGANSFSAGSEHMHFSVTEPWTDHQLNAVSYTHWRWRNFQGGSAYKRARLAPGNGVVRVVSKGYTTHKDVSHFAGFNDRSDPGLGLEHEYERIERGVHFFDRHHHFGGF